VLAAASNPASPEILGIDLSISSRSQNSQPPDHPGELRIVASLKSEPALNLLAAYDK